MTAQSTLTIPSTRTPGIHLVKTASIAGFNMAGTPVTYSYQLTNSGNVTLNPVSVTDPMAGLSAISCPTSTLIPLAVETCTATYTTTQADVDRGSITNTGTASGTPPSGPVVTSPSSVTIPATSTPAISVVKSADVESYSAPSTLITYNYLVTNTGNVTLHSVAVTDPMIATPGVTCPSSTLSVGASETCTASYTTTQADVDRGSITNTGTASGTAPSGASVSASSTLVISAVQAPAIALHKTASPTSFTAPGTAITYSYLVTDTGNTTLLAVGVTDPMPNLSAVFCPETALAPGAFETCTATYTTTQADVDAGELNNTGTATGTSKQGVTVQASSSATVTVTQTFGVGLVKTTDTPSYSAPGTLITYHYQVTNNGNVTLNPVTVTDNKLGAISCPVTSLSPAASETCTATYTTTQGDVDAGSITNVGTATGTTPSGQEISATYTVTIDAVHEPAIAVTKTAAESSFNGPSQTVQYSYTVTNSGNETLDPVTVTDNKLGAISCPDTSLDPGISETCQATYITTQADVDAGNVTNTATATGQPPSGPDVTDTSTLVIPARQNPSLTLVKTAGESSFDGPGQQITYSYEVTNSGNVTLTSIVVTDPMAGLSAIDCSSPTLAVGDSETCTATYTTTQADVDRGSITNTATATASPPSGPPVTAISTTTVPAALNPAVELAKSASVDDISAAGTFITYTYKVTNSGNVTINSVSVTDPQPGLSAVTCPDPDLAPEATEDCTATYTTTQADVDRGDIANTGTVTARGPLGQQLSDQASLTLPAMQQPAIGLVKSASITSFTLAGRPVTYIYTVTNTGNVTLTSVGVTDPMDGLSAPACPFTVLAPGQSEACTASYTTTQDDVDNGGITNTGTATGTPPPTTPPSSPVTAQSTLTIPAQSLPAISLEKSADVSSFSATGTVITYSYKVTNSGNKTLHDITVGDDKLGAITCPDATLTPGASETCSATYSTTQTDLDNGAITNTGTASGTPPTGPAVTATSAVTVAATQTPGISVVKSADIPDYSAAGTTVTYSYLVRNSGNVTLHAVGVSDLMTGLSGIDCPSATLIPGASETCTATYTTTQADVDNGEVVNTGTATGLGPEGQSVADSSTLTLPAIRTPGIKVDKSANPTTFSETGTVITYSYEVTNTGNVTLTSVTVNDDKLGAISCPDATLVPAQIEECTATYTTTQADLDAGSLTNTATATGQPPDSLPVPTDQSTVDVTASESPAISLAKTASINGYTTPGVPIVYTYTVTNGGNVTLHDVGVTDPMANLSAITCPSSTLSPGASEACTASYTTTQADVDRGSISNTGTAAGTSPDGADVSAISSVTISGTPSPGIHLVKSSDVSTFSTAGTLIVYNYLVTNTGNVTLTSVTVSDPMTGLSSITCPDPTLAPAASETCSATYTILQSDVDRGSITNTGTATGTPPAGAPVSNSSTLTITIAQAPGISVDKTASISSYSVPGTPVTYSYLVTNSGNVTLDDVGVTDAMVGLSAVTCPDPALAPAASETCSATYTTTQADVDNGSITNTGTATGTPPTGAPVSDQSSVTLEAVQSPGLTMVKSDDTASFSGPGTVVTYSYLVTNTGNVTLTSIHVTDPLPGISAVMCPIAPLAPGDSTTCTATYTSTQADVDAGGISNTATASGAPPSGTPLTTTPSSVFIPAVQTPSISLVKSASVGSYAAPGTTIVYRYLVMNAGNVTLDAITVTDPMTGLSGIDCPQPSLAPDAFETCTATYITTEADVDAGSITNTGTAAGTPPTGTPVSDSDKLTITGVQRPLISITKSADVQNYLAAGTPIVYTYQVVNTGNVTLDPVTVTDNRLGAIDCPDSTLAPGDSETCTASYTTTQADVDAGNLSNTATVTGVPPIGPAATDSSSVTVNAQQQPAITMVKSASINSFATREHPGHLQLPGHQHRQRHAHLGDRGRHDDRAVRGHLPRPDARTDRRRNLHRQLYHHPGRRRRRQHLQHRHCVRHPALGKRRHLPAVLGHHPCGAGTGHRLDQDGQHQLLRCDRRDDHLQLRGHQHRQRNAARGERRGPAAGPVDRHMSQRQAGDRRLGNLQRDLHHHAGGPRPGDIVNTATATGAPPVGLPVSDQATTTVDAVATPDISLQKKADTPSFSNPGTVITYRYIVTNTGNVTLDPVTVTDNQLGTIACPDTSLAPNDAETCTANYTTTQADVDAGSIVNTATASGTPPSGTAVTSPPSTVTILAAQAPAIGVVKSAVPSSFSAPDTLITYTYVVSNVGNVDLHSITVTDNKLGAIPCPDRLSRPATARLCTATYTTTQVDVDAAE